MSGSEVFGLILGVLPLLISAAEHYRSTSRPFHRWRNYNDELERFQAELLCQECNFCNECHILLSSITGWNVAESEQRLKFGSDSEWLTPELNSKFVAYLGSSHDAVCSTIRSINESLAFIESKSRKFQSVVAEHALVSVRNLLPHQFYT